MCKMKEERDEEQGEKCQGFAAAVPWPLYCVRLCDCRPAAPFPVFSDSLPGSLHCIQTSWISSALLPLFLVLFFPYFT